MKKILKIFLGSIIFLTIINFYFQPCRSEEIINNILFVSNSGSGNYSKIQDAIDNASYGDTIFVYNGIYYENFIMNKTVNLIGENRNNTIINGSIEISTDNATISGFCIKNGQGVRIKGYVVSGFSQYFYNNTITNNIITGDSYFGNGISLIWAFNTKVTNNTIINRINGIFLQYASNNIIEGNDITNNSKEGILISFSWDNTIYRNNIENNEYGFYFDFFGEKNNITQNFIKSNSKYGVYIYDYSCENNNLYTNNFINNTINAYDEFNNSWDNGLYGNYWDDYNGLDKNNNGIGDKPYPIPGGNNFDKYPLMMPYDGTLRIKEFYVDYGSVFYMLAIGMIIVVIVLIPIALYWRKKYFM